MPLANDPPVDDEAPALRAARRDLAEDLAAIGPVRVFSLLALAGSAGAERSEALGRDSSLHLFLDLGRIALFAPDPGAQGADLESVVRLLLDGHPAVAGSGASLERLAEAVAENPAPILPSPAERRLVRRFAAGLRPGPLRVLDRAKGEIETVEPIRHPAVERPRLGGSRLGGPTWAPKPTPRPADRSLRGGAPPDLSDLVSRHAGVVRSRHSRFDASSLPFATTVLRWDGGTSEEKCFGKADRRATAEAIAACEAVERFHLTCPPAADEFARGSFAEIAAREGIRAVDPRRLFFGRSPLCPDDAPPVYRGDESLHWTSGTTFDGETVRVPAQEVYFSRGLDEPAFVQGSTNGVALGGSPEEAALFGLLETIERDAFLVAWYLRWGGRRVDPEAVVDETLQATRLRWHHAFPDYDLRLVDLTHDLRVPTAAMLAVRRRGDGPALHLGLSSRPTFEAAALSALEDLSSFAPEIAPDIARRRRLEENPSLVTAPVDHMKFAATDLALDRARFLVDAPSREPVEDPSPLLDEGPEQDVRRVLGRVVERLEAVGVEPVFVDLTQPWARKRGLFCVEAVTPGLHPIWFGHRRRRVGLTDRLRRLGRELVGRPIEGADDLHLELHPFG